MKVLQALGLAGDAAKLRESARHAGIEFVHGVEGTTRDPDVLVHRNRSYHNNISYTSAARVFPRRVDAFLIGGLVVTDRPTWWQRMNRNIHEWCAAQTRVVSNWIRYGTMISTTSPIPW